MNQNKVQNQSKTHLFTIVSIVQFVIIIVMGFIIFSKFRTLENKVDTNQFSEINVERLNIVEKDGRIRMAISNEEQLPKPIIDGREVDLRQGPKDPGMIFYNDEGDECGGFLFGAETINGQKVAGSALMFDQYKQDQILQLMYHQVMGQNQMVGLKINDKPEDITLSEMVDLHSEIQQLKPEERAVKMQEMQEKMRNGEFGSERLFVGTINDTPQLILKDKKGVPRIKLFVDNDGNPKMVFCDSKGSPARIIEI